MSKKHLARTVIEGGRDGWSKFHRRYSHAAARAAQHRQEHELLAGRDADEAVFEPLWPVHRSFSDKLGPARRFLRSQVGRPWDKVQAELFERFDTRTTAGRHILYCHLLREVELDRITRYDTFYVSAHGILRWQQRKRWSYVYGQREPLPEPRHVVDAWLASRRVTWRDSNAYWLLPVASGRYRQHHRLTAEEQTRYLALPRWFREQVETLESEP
ncbi:MAG TPA: hypothetical protein VHM25_04750 [Polyangiaceae bacterium]|nr:hypothetical protein [Polyangiaceae bacterium]